MFRPTALWGKDQVFTMRYYDTLQQVTDQDQSTIDGALTRQHKYQMMEIFSSG